MEQKMKKGKVKFLGWGNTEGAEGIFISITKCLLECCRLIVQTNAGVWYADNKTVKTATENFGVGLRFLDVYAINDDDIEAVFEPIPDALPKFVYVNSYQLYYL